MSKQINEHCHESEQALWDALVAAVVAYLENALSLRGRASMALCGGSTPAPLYRRLADVDIDWSRVTITLTDERWVSPESELSNQRLLTQTLLAHRAKSAQLLPLWYPSDNLADAQRLAEQALATFAWPLDVTLLGMGNDMHTASLFPGAKALAAGLDRQSGQRCIALQPPNVDPARLSLTLPAILHSRHLLLLIRGEEKWSTYQQSRLASSALSAPISALWQQDEVDVNVYWSA